MSSTKNLLTLHWLLFNMVQRTRKPTLCYNLTLQSPNGLPLFSSSLSLLQISCLMWLEPGSCWLSSRTYLWGLHLCQRLHWQFFVCLWKITRLAIFRVHCKICNFLQACKFLNSLQFFAIFPLLYKIYENCEKSQGWWFFAIICDFHSSLLCCSSSWKPDMDFTNFAKNLKVNDFLTYQISISSCKFYNSCSYVQTWTCLPSVGVKTRLEIAWWVSTNAWYTFC